MKWPFVLRIRLDFAEQIISERDKRIAELIEANKLAMEALDAVKETVHSQIAESNDLASRPRRLLGSDIRDKATKAAIERAKTTGKASR